MHATEALEKNAELIDDRQAERLHDVYRRYRLLSTDPEGCRPMILVNTPVSGLRPWEERLVDPMVMLEDELAGIKPHLEIGDDRVPTVRVQFGTAQIAAAFGCEMAVPTNNLPCASTHVLSEPERVFDMKIPDLKGGWYGKLEEWTALWKRHLPRGVHIQHPDLQSAFNSAHLIRGNDILLDFYDCPEAVDRLLDLVTDFMIQATAWLKADISGDREWFFDWGSLWKGTARTSNCSMHMISPDLYRKHVHSRDRRFFEAVGGGRMHYCGTHGTVIDDFFRIPGLNGFDCDLEHHDFWEICRRAPAQVAVTPTGGRGAESDFVKRLLSGDWPAKRNLIIPVSAPTIEKGRELMEALRKSMPY